MAQRAARGILLVWLHEAIVATSVACPTWMRTTQGLSLSPLASAHSGSRTLHGDGRL